MLLGEWLYNLRCALDYAVYAAAVWNTGEDPPPKHGQLQFPCSFDERNYRDNEYRLAPLTDYQRTELIEFMQPFRHPDPDTSALGWLHRLARIDRHRRLTVMTAYLAESNPKIGVPEGCTVKLEFVDRVLVAGKAELARFTVTPWEPSWKVDVDPRTGLDPEIAVVGLPLLETNHLQRASPDAACGCALGGGAPGVRLHGLQQRAGLPQSRVQG